MNDSVYYLNNTGQRWTTSPTRQVRLVCKADGYDKLRRVEYWEQIGNFAVPVIRYKGKRIRVTIEGNTGTYFPIAWVDYKELYRSFKI